jgi:hypothetical protein
MSTVSCPHCHQGVENRADLALQVVSCPHCRGEFQMPQLSMVVPRGQPIAQQPMVFVNAAPKQRPRAKSSQWFGNSLGAAAAFFLCAMLFVFGTCGGLWYWGKYQVTSRVEAFKEDRSNERAKWREVAGKHLKLYDFKDVSNDTTYHTYTSPHFLEGTCRDKKGKLHDFKIDVKRAEFDGEVTWEILRVEIDGEERYSSPDA